MPCLCSQILRLKLSFFFILIYSLNCQAIEASVLGIEELYRLDLLPQIQNDRKVGMFSSYDRSGGNDDGFSGKYSFYKKTPNGDLILGEIEGPGAIYRIWTPTPTNDIIEFYLDGESKPRIRTKVSDLFSGSSFPFVEPLVGRGVGGYYSYIPIAFSKGCKIVLKAKTFQFYQINYAQYTRSARVDTFSPKSRSFKKKIKNAKKLFSMKGQRIVKYLLPRSIKDKEIQVNKTLAPGGTVTLLDTTVPGRIVGLEIGPASSFEGGSRDVILRAFWDDSKIPAIEAPVSDLFGYSFGKVATQSLFIGTNQNDMNYIYFPMPFQKNVKIELEMLSSRKGAFPVKAKILTADLPKKAGEGRFYANWVRENPTKKKKPFQLLSVKGRGHIVGTILQSQGPSAGDTEFFEGDDQAFIDGKLAIQGTGTEDMFNGGWYDVPNRWESQKSFPLSGSLGYEKHFARTGGYRFLITDRYFFNNEITHTVEHGPKDNLIPTDYTGVSFLYLQNPPQQRLSSSLTRNNLKVKNPKKIVYQPGWSLPIISSSFRNAEINKKNEKIGNAKVRYLNYSVFGDDIFGDHHLSFNLEVPEKAKYKVSLKPVLSPNGGMVQLFHDGRPVGKPMSLSSQKKKEGRVSKLGVLKLQMGENRLFFHFVKSGKPTTAVKLNVPGSKDKERFEIGIAQIVLEKVR